MEAAAIGLVSSSERIEHSIMPDFDPEIMYELRSAIT